MESPNYEFAAFWESNDLLDLLKQQEEDLEVLEHPELIEEKGGSRKSWLVKVGLGVIGLAGMMSGVAATNPNRSTFNENGDGLRYLEGSSAITNHAEAIQNYNNLGIQRTTVQRKYHEEATQREVEYLDTFRTITRSMDTIKQQISEQEIGRGERYEQAQRVLLFEQVHVLNDFYREKNDRDLLMEVNDKLVSLINKTCCYLQDIAQQIDFLQNRDDRWVRTRCKGTLASLFETTLGFGSTTTEIHEYIILQSTNLSEELIEKVKCLMKYMCNSVELVPRVREELDIIIETGPVSDIKQLKCGVDSVRVFLQIDLNNYRTISENKVPNFADLAIRDIQSADDLPQTSNNHPRFND